MRNWKWGGGGGGGGEGVKFYNINPLPNIANCKHEVHPQIQVFLRQIILKENRITKIIIFFGSDFFFLSPPDRRALTDTDASTNSAVRPK